MEKLLENYWVEHYPSGIVQLMFSTSHKWLRYHRYSDDTYVLETHEGKMMSEEVNIPETELALDKDTRYVRYSNQEKDQISFLFIPYELLGFTKTDGKYKRTGT